MGDLWGTSKTAVTMTEDNAKALVALIVQEVTAARQTNELDQYKQLVALQGELSKERETVARLNIEVSALHDHIRKLNAFLTTMAPGAGHPVFNPYNNNGSIPSGMAQPIPTFDGRYAASVPVPTSSVPFTAAPYSDLPTVHPGHE